MKKLMLALLLAVPMFGEMHWGTWTQGTITVSASKLVWPASIAPTNPRTSVYVNVVTTDTLCDVYYLKITYAMGGRQYTVSDSVSSKRARDYGIGHEGDDTQVHVLRIVKLPVDVEVLSLSVIAAQINTLDTQEFR